MTSLPNPFDSSAQMFLAPDEAAVPADSQSPVTAAEIQNSCGGVEVRHAATGNKTGSIPEEARYPSATRFVREEVQGAATQPCVGVTPDPQEDISLFELCIRGFDEAKFLFDIGCVPEDFEKYMALVDQLIEDDEPPLFLQRTG